ncbi:hypothetical protein [uncultured Eudoraea sp.]|uniref:hypothetical protein n=1 Tax=uncultured Eudoraea sp. TaxID=1035614 RepID=UPI0026105F5F|nr:hypothetical protein [uncultured Eudoraea sp.]
MKPEQQYLGAALAHLETHEVNGEYVNFENEDYYKISNSNNLRPFFMSIVSDSNHWMFISSNGALTAGRKDSESSLFPYYTDDKITESLEVTGSKTLLQVHLEGKSLLWEPFSDRYEGLYTISRNLYKNNTGNKIIFEEINKDLGLTFRYQWNSSNKFGFVRKASLINNTKKDLKLTLLDGLQNILPYGVNTDLQNGRSNLVDAYKKSELESDTGLGIFALSAIIVDKAEPSEALKATIAWSVGLEKPTYLVSSLQLNDFRRGESLKNETDIKAEKGAYFISSDLNLARESQKQWMLVANVNQGPAQVIDIKEKLKSPKDLAQAIDQDIALGTQNLIDLAAAADGLQLTSDKLRTARHYSNVLYNIMRGGIFDKNYEIQKKDFTTYLQKANKKVWKDNKAEINALPVAFSLKTLHQLALENTDNDFKRLCFEYMPLKFSRRHGDPSRPWNKFSINTQSEVDGSNILDYQGNWRDIFQNWEALAHSYPEFIDSMIHKFLNATTFEGYNPYRVTKDGFDWEIIEPDDPWSYIGYWGDHQIIYLLKFLEFIQDYYPARLEGYFNQDLFVYANVPYKIKSYQDTLKNPKDTIDFDHKLSEEIIKRKEEMGADGALLTDKNGEIYRVNLLEKLLVTLMAKCSNFIPEAGIWLNTQRPEWNDANNALVGNGVSMVTLYYIRRFLSFFQNTLKKASFTQLALSEELITFFEGLSTTLEKYENTLKGKISDSDRKLILDGLGQAGSNYRATIYAKGFSGSRKNVSKADMLNFVEVALKYMDHSIDANKRADKMYHAYNLMSVENDKEIAVSYLSEMLEGQVAVLSSGYLSSEACLEVLDALKASSLFREDQYSYILYPDKDLPRFVDKNKIPAEKVAQSKLMQQLLKDGNTTVLEQDVAGDYHFNGSFNNADSLKKALAELPEGPYKKLIEEEQHLLLDTFEEVFDHKSFTGRSGTFFGYEGLGSIYWHMVSKLLLAVMEYCLKAIEEGEDEAIIGRLIDHYYEINAGIGVHKSPELYGAFPTDPYSHTPAGKGAQQPGMTGQVKEDILSRMGELGVAVKEGKITFSPGFFNKAEFLKAPAIFSYVDVDFKPQQIAMEKECICFTYCQVPVVYKLAEQEDLEVFYANKTSKNFETLELDRDTSKQLFERTGEVSQIVVSLRK